MALKFEYDIEFTDNSDLVLEALQDWAERVLDILGGKIKDYAQLILRDHVNTSRLKNSIEYEVDPQNKTVTVGTNAESDTAKWPNGAEFDPAPYPVYVELGTGVYATDEDGNPSGEGRQKPWYWYDMKTKQWHFTRGVKPRPFLRPAIKDHLDEYKQIAIDEAKD